MRLFQALLVSPHVKAVVILDLILGLKHPFLPVCNEAGIVWHEGEPHR